MTGALPLFTLRLISNYIFTWYQFVKAAKAFMFSWPTQHKRDLKVSKKYNLNTELCIEHNKLNKERFIAFGEQEVRPQRLKVHSEYQHKLWTIARLYFRNQWQLIKTIRLLYCLSCQRLWCVWQFLKWNPGVKYSHFRTWILCKVFSCILCEWSKLFVTQDFDINHSMAVFQNSDENKQF